MSAPRRVGVAWQVMSDGPSKPDDRAPAGVTLPVACTLGPADGAARMARWQRLSHAAAPTVRRDGHRLEVRYPPGPGVRAELEALVAAEAECCAFVAWAVTEVDGAPVLRVTADADRPDDVAPIAALFGAG